MKSIINVWGVKIAKIVSVCLVLSLLIEAPATVYATELEQETEIKDTEIEDDTGIVALDLTSENLSNPDNYIYGWYKSWGGKYASASSMICTADYYLIPDETYYIHISDSRLEINIAEYDANENWLKHTDKIYDGSTFTKQENTEYIRITIFSTVWGVKPFKLLSDGLEIDFESDYQEEEPIEEMDGMALTKDNLSNVDNYMYGWYKSWGGKYEESSSMVCSVDYYKPTSDTYFVYINDSRITLSISEYDADKTWLKYTDKITNGSVFTKQEKTEYIMITCLSSVWGVKPMNLLQNGLEIEFSTNENDSLATDTISIEDADFANVDNWKSGTYSYQTGAFGIDSTMICYVSYLNVGSDAYLVNLPEGYLKMTILELDDEGNVIKNTDFSSGQKWTKQDATTKIAITVYASKNSSSYNLDEYKNIISGYPKFGLSKYEACYIPSGDMKDLSASAFVKNMNVGWNLGNSLDSKSSTSSRGEDANLKQELNWGNPYITKDLIDYVAASGFNTIRIPVTWYYNTYTDEDGNLRVGEKWLNRVQEVVDYAMADGMYVILNTHHEQPILYAGVDDDEMSQVLADAGNLWLDIAEYFKDYDEHLIFESYNEIDNLALSWNYSDTAAAQMNKLNQVFVDTVRGTGGNNANRILMVPTLLDGYDENFYNAFVMPTDTASDRIVVTVHNYSKPFNQDVEAFFTHLEQFSDTIGAPIVIGEFGTTKNYELGDFRQEHASNFVARAAEHGVKCIWWDNGSDYAIIDRTNLSNSNTGIINALMEGSQGVAYQITDETVFDNISEFQLVMPNLNTGGLETKYWGTITTLPGGTGAIPVVEGTKCMMNLITVGDASDIWLQRVVFYDANGNYLSGKEIQKRTYIFDIPENAAYMRVSMNSAYRSIKLEEFTQYLSDGDLQLCISLPNSDNVEKILLQVK